MHDETTPALPAGIEAAIERAVRVAMASVVQSGSPAFAQHPAYATVDGWLALSGMGRTSTYEALARGDLHGIKVGTRLLIDVASGLAWLRSRPAAAINLPGTMRRATRRSDSALPPATMT